MPESDRPRQIPLVLSVTEGRTRDDLVVTEANREAVDLVDRWPDWPSPIVVLAGPAGAGKSHIGAVWRDASGAALVDPRRIDASAIDEAAHVSAFLDDADRGGLDETGLFHLINAAREGGTSVLIASRRFPASWGLRLPDLASRLRAAATVEIQEPDDALLAGVITKLFADRQVDVEPYVVQYLVRRIERSLATAIRVVEKLDRTALEQKARISRGMAADVVSALDQGQSELDV